MEEDAIAMTFPSVDSESEEVERQQQIKCHESKCRKKIYRCLCVLKQRQTEKERKNIDIDVLSALEEDDVTWHEKQINGRNYIREKMDEYIGGLTVHGLTKVFTGTRAEKWFWFVMLCMGTALTLFVVQGLFAKYLERHVYVQINSQMVDEKVFPSITFCDENKLFESYYAYCGFSCRQKEAKSTAMCKEKYMHLNNNTASMKDGRWTNGLFTVNACYTWGSKNCNSPKYLQTVRRYNDACFTWNFNGNLSDIYGHFLIDFSFNHTFANESPAQEETSIIALPHDPDILELDFTLRNQMEPMKTLTMVFDNILIKRLPHPFPSNCTTSKPHDIFPGSYSRRSCIETQNYVEMYRECGDVVDYVRHYMPDKLHEAYSRNQSIVDTCNCIKYFSKLESIKVYCPFPCKEIEISVQTNFNKWSRKDIKAAQKARVDNNLTQFRLDFQYQRVDSYRVIEEQELYTLYQMACEVGGFVGLVIGASLLSFIEIFTLTGLSLWRRFYYSKVK